MKNALAVLQLAALHLGPSHRECANGEGTGVEQFAVAEELRFNAITEVAQLAPDGVGAGLELEQEFARLRNGFLPGV